jgi:hypothetical protein
MLHFKFLRYDLSFDYDDVQEYRKNATNVKEQNKERYPVQILTAAELTLLCGCETWFCHDKDIQQSTSFRNEVSGSSEGIDKRRPN